MSSRIFCDAGGVLDVQASLEFVAEPWATGKMGERVKVLPGLSCFHLLSL